MKARIIKKLSNKIKLILTKEYKDAWIDNEIMEQSYDQGSRVSNCQNIGGGLDEWGEGTYHYTVIYDFKHNFLQWQGFWGFYGEESRWEDSPKGAPYRLTGQKLIKLAKQSNNKG
tara:strand:+ start:733 stop:1077 length:345 start_codon:yes stop_codon:yes gene_type:complete